MMINKNIRDNINKLINNFNNMKNIDLIFSIILIFITISTFFISKHKSYVYLHNYISITLILGWLSYYISKHIKGNIKTFKEWINYPNENINYKIILVTGIISGIIIGLVNSIGLFYNTIFLYNDLSKIVKSLSFINTTDEYLALSGIGNIINSSLGYLLSNFISRIIFDLAEIKSAPIWMTSIGQFIGSSLGLLIPLYIRGKIQLQPFDINIEVKSESTVYSTDELSPAFSKK